MNYKLTAHDQKPSFILKSSDFSYPVCYYYRVSLSHYGLSFVLFGYLLMT